MICKQYDCDGCPDDPVERERRRRRFSTFRKPFRRMPKTPPSGAAVASSTWEASWPPASKTQAVGDSDRGATEWSGGRVINLGSLPGFRVASPPASTTPGKCWDKVRSPPYPSPPPGRRCSASERSASRDPYARGMRATGEAQLFLHHAQKLREKPLHVGEAHGRAFEFCDGAFVIQGRFCIASSWRGMQAPTRPA
jgi:hypothetical protein